MQIMAMCHVAAAVERQSKIPTLKSAQADLEQIVRTQHRISLSILQVLVDDDARGSVSTAALGCACPETAPSV